MAEKYTTVSIGEGLASMCERCGSLVPYHGEGIHDKWHRIQDDPKELSRKLEQLMRASGMGLRP